MEKPRIVVVDDELNAITEICELLRSKGYEVSAVPVFKEDDCLKVVKQVKVCNPDIILMDERLTNTLRGFHVLEALGGEFYKPGIPGGNPRVISISGAPCADMVKLVGGSFIAKKYVKHMGDDLLTEISRCAGLIPEKV